MAEQPDHVTRLTRWQRIGIAALGLLCAGLVGAVLFIWSGYYNVAAGREHLSLTTWILEQVRDQSIKSHSDDIEVPELDDPNLIRLGAAHYQGACVFCHGSPDQPRNPIVANMLPAPPDLSASSEYSPAEVYWIVLNGLKYTGMPAWPAEGRGDEVWALVALIESFKTSAGGSGHGLANDDRPAAKPGHALAEGSEPPVLTDCVRCHGDETAAPISNLVPSLSGLSKDYIMRSLEEYRSNRRQSGIMEPVAFALTPEVMEKLATYYASLTPLPLPEINAPEAIDNGRRIAAEGVPEADVPACLACHGASRSNNFPALDGQPAAYLEAQLRLWHSGGRALTGYGAIMAPVARRMTAQQIRDVSLYFQARSVQGGSSP
ncbi:cytochrome c553 [Rhodoligotrophos appendicifer]|uniref:c-type cytochrome n=1 Tax=Rhodoligotrophos appendicifer TaxID=987056 RepID=UPI001FE3B723|nr:c-type cytochrome [Rhodoligotrophos appendicifer]